MNTHFYLGEPLQIIISKNVESEMHSIFFVKLKNCSKPIEYYFGNIGDELESPYIRFRGRWTSFGHEDILDIRRPHEIEYVVGILLDKKMAENGSAGRFAKEYNANPFRLKVMNDLGQIYSETLDSTIYSNIIGTVTVKNYSYSLIAKKFDWEEFLHNNSISMETLWSMTRKGLVYQWSAL